MKFFRKSPTQRPQKLIQPLECRRLMSLTAVMVPPPMALAQSGHIIMHSFGFEQAPREASLAGYNPPAQLPPPDFDGSLRGTARQQATQPGPETTNPAVTLSTLYSTLGSSTVAQIDAASTQSLAAVVESSIADQMRVSFTTQAASQIVTTSITTAEKFIDSEPAVTSEKALAKAILLFGTPSAIETPLATFSETESSTPSWASLRRLEADMIAAQTVANQIVSELGREGAIALSHLESVIDDAQPVLHALSANWRSAAVAAGTIATLALLQKDTEKKASPFSTKLIEEVVV
jgi:hypothetical protein